MRAALWIPTISSAFEAAAMDTASALGNGTEVLPRWLLRVFGGFELGVHPGGERVTLPGKRERVLLAYLTLSPNYRQPRRKLVSLLWGDTADETTLDNLRNCLWNLRKALGDTEHRVVVSDGEDIVLDAAAFDVDALAFRRLATQSSRTDLEAAATLYSGELLDGLIIESDEFETWRRAEASRYRDQAIDVLSRLVAQCSGCGETERAIEAGERILRLEPLHEAAIRRLMQHYGESGRRGAAIQLYRTFAEALRTELDAQPEAETRLALAQIAQGGEERASSPAAAIGEPTPCTSMARRRDTPVGPTSLPGRQASRLRAPLMILAAALIAAIGLVSYRQFAVVSTPDAILAERAVAADPATAISIAVLPFLNLSGDANQEFFSDGMTEEITSALAMVPDLKVVARTSAFQFKGEKQDLRAVGQALNATHLIEGSVRKEGDRVRITAQLIEAGKGTHLWSESYDRRLSDIFATQEEIARMVVGSLMTPLGLAPGERLVSNRAIDPESYEQYLRARTIFRSGNSTDRMAGATAMLEQVVARDPGYAPAWALLALMTFDLDRKETAAREAIRLDSRNAAGYAALAQIQLFGHGNFAAGEDLYRQALALDPNDPDVLDALSNRLAAVGRIKEALSLREKLRTLEPFAPVYNYITASIMLIGGQGTAAIPILEALPGSPARHTALAHAYASQGQYGAAADTILEIRRDDQLFGPVEDAARLIRSAPTNVKAPEALPALDNQLSFVYLYVGAPDRVLDYQERLIAEGKVLISQQVRYLWSPNFASVRKTERFKALMRAAKYVDYWRARGWPDLCRPVSADDFVCV
jgi:adenylate cyclase